MTRLFHTILPIPECCSQQMRLCGNMNIHEVHYQCSRCFKNINVKVEFVEDKKPEISPEVKESTDATE